MNKILGMLFLAGFSQGLSAQAIKNNPPMKMFKQEEILSVSYPDLQFEESDSNVKVYDKYFYFHRNSTSFNEAYADIKECDALASGISYYAGGSEPYPGYYGAQYGVGGAIGGLIGSAMADAIFGSAERRKTRRINLRNCMGFKEYDRYGLDRELWQRFNFEEGHGRVEGDKRQSYLLMQAKVASGPKPEQGILER